MRTLLDRRHFVGSASAAGAAGFLGSAPAPADEEPLETTTVRLRVADTPQVVVSGVADNAICEAPLYVAQELLPAEGFTEVRYVPVRSGPLPLHQV